MTENSRETFFRRLDASRKSTFLVAGYLHKAGYNINIPAFDYNEDNGPWEDHVDDGDLYIWRKGEDQHRIDVKHISIDFTTRDSYKFNYVFVADIRAVHRADPFPLAYIVVNKSCTHIAIIWGKTKKFWTPHDVYASNTKKMITVMRCPVEHADFRSLNYD
jgi:hypothetical protein